MRMRTLLRGRGSGIRKPKTYPFLLFICVPGTLCFHRPRPTEQRRTDPAARPSPCSYLLSLVYVRTSVTVHRTTIYSTPKYCTRLHPGTLYPGSTTV